MFTSGVSDLLIQIRKGNNKESQTLITIFKSLVKDICCSIKFVTCHMKHFLLIKCITCIQILKSLKNYKLQKSL